MLFPCIKNGSIKKFLITLLISQATSSSFAELRLPRCEEIPVALCQEERVKNFCGRQCGKFIEGQSELIKPQKWPSSEAQMVSQGPRQNQNQASQNGTKHFLAAPKIIQKAPRNTTLSPGMEEAINEFFNPGPRLHFTSTTIPSTTKANKFCDQVHACIDLPEANRRFLNRCQTSQPPIQASCFGFCRYDVTMLELKNAFIHGLCPIGQTRLYLNAASGFNDHTYCCSASGVLNGRQDICFPFCNPNGPVWPNRGEALKYLPCMQALEQIMRCHWAGLR